MPTEDVVYQQRLKIRRTTLGFGVIQVVLGLALTGLSFTAFVLSESEKIRNACPYWAGFTVFCSGGVGIVAWRHTTVLSMGLFTFFSAVCVVLHMIGTILTGEIGGLLKSIIMCQDNIATQSCMCCDSIMTCKQNVPTFEFKGVEDCRIITGLMKELMYGLCVLNIFGSLVCFIATILGCTSVARQAGRDQPFFRRRLSTRSDSHDQSQYSWLHYPADANVHPPYAPPIYRSVDNVHDCGATPYIVPPPVFDPTDLPPPYSSRNASLSSSGISLDVPDPNLIVRRPRDEDDNSGGCSAVVVSENRAVIHHYENHYQQRVYSENRVRPGNAAQVTSVVITRDGISERPGCGPRTERFSQTVSSSQLAIQSEKAEECRESNESVNNQDGNYKSKQTSGCLSTVERVDEIIKLEENRSKRKHHKEIKRNITKTNTNRKSCKITEDDFSSTSDSGIGEEISSSTNGNEINSVSSQNLEQGFDTGDDVKEGLLLSSDCPGRKQPNVDLNHLISCTQESISFDGDSIIDDISGSNDTIVPGSWDENIRELDVTESLVKESQTAPLNPIQSQRLENKMVFAPRKRDSQEQDFDLNKDEVMPKNDVRTVYDISGNKTHEHHVTDEVIRLMDDFESNVNRSPCASSTLDPGASPTFAEGHSKRITNDELRSGYLHPEWRSLHRFTESVHPHGKKEESRTSQGNECFNKGEASLARSDTCITALPKTSRESRAGSDPGVNGAASFGYPLLHRLPFQLVPPNIELPMEIREEIGIFSNLHDSRRRKRYGERETPRSKRRALASKDELMKLKSKNHHRTNRKDELTRIRERHIRSQHSRLKTEVARSHLQKYKAKSSSQKSDEELLANSLRFPSIRRGKNPQPQSSISRQGSHDASRSSATEQGTCTGELHPLEPCGH